MPYSLIEAGRTATARTGSPGAGTVKRVVPQVDDAVGEGRDPKRLGLAVSPSDIGPASVFGVGLLPGGRPKVGSVRGLVDVDRDRQEVGVFSHDIDGGFRSWSRKTAEGLSRNSTVVPTSGRSPAVRS